jgi:hypothetical protein
VSHQQDTLRIAPTCSVHLESAATFLSAKKIILACRRTSKGADLVDYTRGLSHCALTTFSAAPGLATLRSAPSVQPH